MSNLQAYGGAVVAITNLFDILVKTASYVIDGSSGTDSLFYL